MRAKEFLFENAEVTLYHVTKTSTLPRIFQKGITGMNPTNFVKAASGEQYGNIGEIFAMTSKKDAIRWGARWEWSLFSKMGTGEVSIITFKDNPKSWEIDVSDPLGQSSNEGNWLKKSSRVAPKQIISTEPITTDMIKTLTL